MSFLNFWWTSFTWISFSKSLFLSCFSFRFFFFFLSLYHYISFSLSISLSHYLSISLSLYLSIRLFHSLYFSISLSFHLSITLFFSPSLLSLLLPLVSSRSSCNLPLKSSLLLMNTDKLFCISKKYYFVSELPGVT